MEAGIHFRNWPGSDGMHSDTGQGNDLGKNGWRVDLLGNSRDRNDVLETHGGGCSFWESTADACWQPARRKEALPVMTGGERTS